MKRSLLILLALTPLVLHPASARLFEDSYTRAIRRTEAMAADQRSQGMAEALGLKILDLTWEDTGRYKNSAVGPNISDMTIQVARDLGDGKLAVSCMPVIRFPNFSDRSCDLDPRSITLLTGNHNGSPLVHTTLHTLLAKPLEFLTHPDSWKPSPGRPRTLLAARDSKVLVSAQACFLPIPKSGQATFNPVLFNYQSVQGDPAVLAILATPEGTSITVIDNTRDAFSDGSTWGQRLFFNSRGQRASLTGSRESDFSAARTPHDPASEAQPASSSALNLVLLIQVPLKQKSPAASADASGSKNPPPAPQMSPESSDVENAVIGHGALEGPFTEINGLRIERDPRFPVRVTVQFYKATSNGRVSPADLQDIKDQIDRVYSGSESVGSLVTDGPTHRPTEHDGPHQQPPDWWAHFWRRHQ